MTNHIIPTGFAALCLAASLAAPAQANSPFDIDCFRDNVENIAAGFAHPSGYSNAAVWSNAPANGVWNLPNANVTATLPPNGILCIKSLSGNNSSTAVRVLSFVGNERNTPVILLVEDGLSLNNYQAISVDGANAVTFFSVGLTRLGGVGGPGGFHGGSCDFSIPSQRRAGAGLGPGGGAGFVGTTGGGGGAGPTRSGGQGFESGGLGGQAVGSFDLRFLHGGSGGGCGANVNGDAFAGGGGGGVLIIAAGDSIHLGGTNSGLRARGGTSTAGGGGGGGGLIRLIAPVIEGAGAVDVRGSGGGNCAVSATRGGCGGHGLIKLEGLNAGGNFVNTAITLHGKETIKYGAPQSVRLSDELVPTVEVTNVRATFDGTVHDQAPPAIDLSEHPYRSPSTHLRDGQTLTVTLRTRHVPDDAVVNLRMNTIAANPQAGTGDVTVQATNPTGAGAERTWTATVTVPLGARLGSLEAWVASVCTPDTAGCPPVN